MCSRAPAPASEGTSVIGPKKSRTMDNLSGSMSDRQEHNRDTTYKISWQAEQALHAWSPMHDAELLGLLEEKVPMNRICETMMRSRASLAERVLVLIEDGFLDLEVLL